MVMFVSHQLTMFLRLIMAVFIVLLIIPILCFAQFTDWKLRSLSTSRARLTMFKTRNMFQCERLCLRYKPCVAVSFSTKSRECSMYSEELTEDDVTSNRDGIVSTGISIFPDSCSPDSCRADSVCVSIGNKAVCLPSARDCQEILETDNTAPDGVYTIRTGSQLIEAYCDMTDDGGGWTVLQRRADGSENFYRNWQDYRKGFGNLRNEFWLGNENIFHLTNRKSYQLKVVMDDYSDGGAFASYSEFRIEDEGAMYRLTVGGYTGTAGLASQGSLCTGRRFVVLGLGFASGQYRRHGTWDSLAVQNNMAFSTYDVDNDRLKHHDCAKSYLGGWWYNRCHYSNLNGDYGNTIYGQGLNWYPFKAYTYSWKFVEMKIRP